MGVQYGIKEDLTLDKVYEYKFDIGHVRDPIVKAITESGWEFVAIVRKDRHLPKPENLDAERNLESTLND